MRPGPAPKPTRIKKMEGNPGKRPLNENEPIPPKSITLIPPPFLNEVAKAEWERIAGEMVAQDILTNWDVATFAAYCEAYSVWVAAQGKLTCPEDFVKEYGKSDYESPSAWYAILRHARKEMTDLAAKMGLNPSERSRIDRKKTPIDKEGKDGEMFGKAS